MNATAWCRVNNLNSHYEMYVQLLDSENMGENYSLFLYKLKWSIPRVIYILNFVSCGSKLRNWETLK